MGDCSGCAWRSRITPPGGWTVDPRDFTFTTCVDETVEILLAHAAGDRSGAGAGGARRRTVAGSGRELQQPGLSGDDGVAERGGRRGHGRRRPPAGFHRPQHRRHGERDGERQRGPGQHAVVDRRPATDLVRSGVATQHALSRAGHRRSGLPADQPAGRLRLAPRQRGRNVVPLPVRAGGHPGRDPYTGSARTH